MSRTYKIHTDITFPLVEMVNKLSELLMFRPLMGKFYHPNYYFYNYSSLRGVEISTGNGFLEIRTTILSNHQDHSMAGSMIRILKELTGGELTNDLDEEINPWFFDGNIYDMMQEDWDVVHHFLKNEEDVKIFGPFGPYLLNTPEAISIFEKKAHIHTMMFHLEELLKQPYKEYFSP